MEAQSQSSKLMNYIRNIMAYGHFNADLNPLSGPNKNNIRRPNSTLSTYGFTEADLDKQFTIDIPNFESSILDKDKKVTLREIRNTLEKAYHGKIGAEFMHIPDRATCNWIRNKIERRFD